MYSTGEKRQIDYIFVDSSRQDCVTTAAAWNGLDGKSDHRAVFGTLRMDAHAKPKTGKKRIPRGWAATLDEQNLPTVYHDLLTDGLSKEHRNLSDVTATVVEAARQGGVGEQMEKLKHNTEVSD
eukprot:9491897-Pyramimonas_sp.AAC.1